MRLREEAAILLLLLCGIPGTAPAQKAPLRAPDVRYEPSSPEIVRTMLRLANVKKNDIVYDLGSGDGRIVIAAARDFGARGVGIDIDPERIRESLRNAREAGVAKRVRFRNEDLFEADIGKATVVTLYLWPSVNLRLKPKLLKELKPGTRVVSHSHDMGDWAPEKEVEVEGHRIYLWTIPARGARRERTVVLVNPDLADKVGLAHPPPILAGRGVFSVPRHRFRDVPQQGSPST